MESKKKERRKKYSTIAMTVVIHQGEDEKNRR